MRTSTDEMVAIGQAARLTGLPVWLLRELDARRIVVPRRSNGGRRLYDGAHVKKLQRISVLVNDRGVNLAGIQVILEMESGGSAPMEV